MGTAFQLLDLIKIFKMAAELCKGVLYKISICLYSIAHTPEIQINVRYVYKIAYKTIYKKRTCNIILNLKSISYR